MVRTREAMRNARGLLLILLVVGVLSLALRHDQDAASDTSPEQVTR